VRETKVETYLCEQVEERGGLCEKHVSPGLVGVPDRLITWPCGVMHLAETKAPGKKPRPKQARDHARRAKRCVTVYVLDTKEKVDEYIKQCWVLWKDYWSNRK
jgi:hypothetical protein